MRRGVCQHKVSVVGPRFAVLGKADRIRTACNNYRKCLAEGGCCFGRETKFDEGFETAISDQTSRSHFDREERGVPFARVDVLLQHNR